MTEWDLNAHLLGYDRPAPPPKVFGLDSPDRLKAWLLSTGREFLVFASGDLVDALPWPHGLEAVQQIVQAYGQHRRTQQVGIVNAFEPTLGLNVQRPVYKGETLTAEELEHAIRCLVRDLRKLSPGWTPSW